MKHKHAETLKAILNGEQLQVKQGGENICSHNTHNTWVDISSNRALVLIGQGCTDTEFRVKPETLCINGMEFPKPLSSLNQGDIYWVPTDLLRACCVEHLGGFTGYLEAGLAFASQADCEAFLSALKSVLKP